MISTSHEHEGRRRPDVASGLLRVRCDAGIPGAKKSAQENYTQLTASGEKKKKLKEELQREKA